MALIMVPPDPDDDQLDLTGVPPNSRRASEIRVRQNQHPQKLNVGERQYIDPDNPPPDCPRCQGQKSSCPLGEPNWRLCPHAF